VVQLFNIYYRNLMSLILAITLKDLSQAVRDKKIFLFTLVMPMLFTLLFGFAFGGFGGEEQASRIAIGWLDQDGSPMSAALQEQLAGSTVIRLEGGADSDTLARRVGKGELAAALIVPPDWGHNLKEGKDARLLLIGETGSAVGLSVENEILSAAIHLDTAARAAQSLEDAAGAPFDYTFQQALVKWQSPPVQVMEQRSAAVERLALDSAGEARAQTSPGMMLQFAIAGLMVSAQMMVSERKTHCWQRLLTTHAGPLRILAGHFLAIFCLVLLQVTLLIAYGQFLLGVRYLYAPAATALVALSVALCMAGLGLLIGTMAQTEEQALVLSLVPMFVLVGLGGGWMPLETMGPAMQMVGRLSPVAWGMDGFKNVLVRGLGVEAALLPSAALALYAVVFVSAAALVMRRRA
jgi:ABC-2 type transport system permease protein